MHLCRNNQCQCRGLSIKERDHLAGLLTTANAAKDHVIETLTRDLADPKSAQVKTEVYDAEENLNI